MEPQPPQSSTPPPPSTPPSADGPDGGTAGPSAPADEPLPNIEIVVCPICREPRPGDARFCEECGHDFAEPPPAPAPEERPLLSGPLLWAIMVFWALLAIGGLYFLYTVLWAI